MATSIPFVIHPSAKYVPVNRYAPIVTTAYPPSAIRGSQLNRSTIEIGAAAPIRYAPRARGSRTR